MNAVLLSLFLEAVTQPAGTSPGVDLRGAWHAQTYTLKDGTRHPVRGSILFTERDWSVVFLVAPDGKKPVRGSGEAGTYRLEGNRLVFAHRYNLGGGQAVEGLPASPLEMNLHGEKDAPEEACTVEVVGAALTIRFPSGNAMTFERARATSLTSGGDFARIPPARRSNP